MRKPRLKAKPRLPSAHKVLFDKMLQYGISLGFWPQRRPQWVATAMYKDKYKETNGATPVIALEAIIERIEESLELIEVVTDKPDLTDSINDGKLEDRNDI